MKRNYKLKLFMAFLFVGVSVGSVSAHLPMNLTTNVIAVENDNWTTIQEENGVAISFSKYEINGVAYLKGVILNWVLISISLLILLNISGSNSDNLYLVN